MAGPCQGKGDGVGGFFFPRKNLKFKKVIGINN